MINEDTVRLLRECNAGIKMGVSSISDVIDKVESNNLRDILESSKREHEDLGNKTREILNGYNDQGKDPNPIAKGMSWMKTNFKMAMDDGDKTVADLMTDGANMGVKSLSRYLNQYPAADQQSKGITKKLIKIEEDLSVGMRDFL